MIISIILALTTLNSSSADSQEFIGEFLRFENSEMSSQVKKQIEKLESQLLRATSESSRKGIQRSIERFNASWRKNGDKDAYFMIAIEKERIFIPAKINIGKRKFSVEAGDACRVLVKYRAAQESRKPSIGSGLGAKPTRTIQSVVISKITAPKYFSDLVVAPTYQRGQYEYDGIQVGHGFIKDLNEQGDLLKLSSVKWAGITTVNPAGSIGTALGRVKIQGDRGGLKDEFHVTIANVSESELRRVSFVCRLLDGNGEVLPYFQSKGVFDLWPAGESRVVKFILPIDKVEEESVSAELKVLSVLK